MTNKQTRQTLVKLKSNEQSVLFLYKDKYLQWQQHGGEKKKKGKQKRNIKYVPGSPAQSNELCSQKKTNENKEWKTNFTDTPCFKGEKR